MEIDGRAIAQTILKELTHRVKELKKQHITPKLAVIRVGHDSAITSYVQQKEYTARNIGIDIAVYPYPDTVTEEELLKKLQQLDDDPTIHGIILQLPIPQHLDQKKLLLAISPEKDVDGFHPQTKFIVPLASAVETILKQIYKVSKPGYEESFISWLKKQQIVVIGKGKTGGTPVIELLQSKNIHPIIIDSSTIRPEESIQNADIIISAVGRNDIVKRTMIKPGCILISVGMTKDSNGKFLGDYTSDEIKEIAGFYTPVPGGVGPVNVAKLMENVIQGAENTLQ